MIAPSLFQLSGCRLYVANYTLKAWWHDTRSSVSVRESTCGGPIWKRETTDEWTCILWIYLLQGLHIINIFNIQSSFFMKPKNNVSCVWHDSLHLCFYHYTLYFSSSAVRRWSRCCMPQTTRRKVWQCTNIRGYQRYAHHSTISHSSIYFIQPSHSC